MVAIGTLASDCRIPRLLGNEFIRVFQVRRLNHDAWGLTAGRIRFEQLRRFQTTFAGPHFPYVDDVTRTKREPVQDHAFSCVRVFAGYVDVDLSNAKLLTFGNVVDQIELVAFIQESRIRAHVCEHMSQAAVDITKRGDIAIHLAGVEELTGLQSQLCL